MRRLINKSKKGFTLIELMIVVAIIGILAAIAIPNFLRFQLKSKTSEAKVNLAAIRTAEESYLAEFGNYVDTPPPPRARFRAGSQKARPSQVAASRKLRHSSAGDPEGQVFFSVRCDPWTAPTVLAYTADAQGGHRR